MPSADVLTLPVAFLITFTLTPLARRAALNWGLVDWPDARKIHRAPTPLLGGAAVYLGAILATTWAVPRSSWPEAFSIIMGATLVSVVGILDDRGLLHPQVKLAIGMPAAALIVMASGVRLPVPSFSWLAPEWEAALSFLLTFSWLVGITAAFSILDHMDGLCAGVAAVAALVFLSFAVHGGQSLVSILAAATLGAALGFLPHNIHPARIFMGDGGAAFLGFMCAVLGLKVQFRSEAPELALLMPALVLAVPILDTALVSYTRLKRGLLPFSAPGKDHLAHRLVHGGLSQRSAVLWLYGAALGAGGAAWLASLSSPQIRAVLLLTLAAATLGALLWLKRMPYEGQAIRSNLED